MFSFSPISLTSNIEEIKYFVHILFYIKITVTYMNYEQKVLFISLYITIFNVFLAAAST